MEFTVESAMKPTMDSTQESALKPTLESTMASTKGQRLLPAMIDEIASSTPDRAFASIPRGVDVREGFVDVSYKQLARAINQCAWWIEEQVGRSVTFETLGYIGPTDLRYAIIFVACTKTGHTVSRVFTYTWR